MVALCVCRFPSFVCLKPTAKVGSVIELVLLGFLEFTFPYPVRQSRTYVRKPSGTRTIDLNRAEHNASLIIPFSKGLRDLYCSNPYIPSAVLSSYGNNTRVNTLSAACWALSSRAISKRKVHKGRRTGWPEGPASLARIDPATSVAGALLN